MTAKLQSGDALLIVDVQKDFCAGGKLEVPKGDSVVPVLNEWIAAARDSDVPVIASRYWHPLEHCSFASQGGRWPEHCVQDSKGAEFHDDLALPEAAIRVSKGTAFDQDAYSAFDGTGLESFLRRRVCGACGSEAWRKTSACYKGYSMHAEKALRRCLFQMRRGRSILPPTHEWKPRCVKPVPKL